MGLITNIADAVVAELKGQDLGQSVEAKRAYRPTFDLAQLKTLRVTVVPKFVTIASSTRSTNQHDVTIDVAVQKKVGGPDDPAIDQLMDLTERIGDLLRLKRLTAVPEAAWVKTENVPIYSVEHLDQLSVFTSVLSISYRVIR